MMGCGGSRKIASRPDLATQLTDGLADSGLNLKEGVFFEVTEVCPGCDECHTECSYWRLKRDSPSVTGFKCGVCDICLDEADQILMRRKDGE